MKLEMVQGSGEEQALRGADFANLECGKSTDLLRLGIA